jgi:EmrB/QacA subfamily drug resistance transporter
MSIAEQIATVAETETDERKGTAQNWVLALTSIASLMVALDSLVISTALTEIGRDFTASIEQLEWTVNAYVLTFAVLLMPASALGDRFGRRRIFISGLALFTLASAACALAPSIELLIAARAVQGVGAAAVMPLALAQISAAFPPERRGWALGIYSSVTALSTVIGPVVGGAVTYGLAWPWVFWLNLPFGLVAIGFSRLRLQETFGPKSAIDFGGVALITGGAFGLVWGLVRGNGVGWTSVETISALALSAVLMIAFVAWELRAPQPMIPMRLFALRAFAAGNATMLLLMGALMSAIFFMAQFQQVALEQDALFAGLRLLPWGMALVLAAPKSGALAERFGATTVIILGLLVHGVGLAWLAAIAHPDMAYAGMIVPMILAGSGFAVAAPLGQKAVVNAVAPADIGKASGTLSMLRQLGSAFGVALAVAAFAHFGSHASPQAFTDGFVAANGVAAMLSFAGAFAGLFLSEKKSA